MASSLHAQVGVPGNQMICALTNYHVAVRANPRLILVLAFAVCGLNDVLDAATMFGLSQTDFEQGNLELGLNLTAFCAPWAVAAAHLVPAIVV